MPIVPDFEEGTPIKDEPDQSLYGAEIPVSTVNATATTSSGTTGSNANLVPRLKLKGIPALCSMQNLLFLAISVFSFTKLSCIFAYFT